MSSSPCVLAFDIGIKNLAWCLMRRVSTDPEKYEVVGWANENILAELEAASGTQSRTCSNCGVKANYETGGTAFCVRHCPPNKPALRDVSGNLLKKVPKLAAMKQLFQGWGAKAPRNGAAGLALLADKFALPIAPSKKKKATEAQLSDIHDGIRGMIERRSALFRQASVILLENQPALKNPTMKSVQMLLFASLRDHLQPAPPPLRLVHAKKKVGGKAKGGAGYAARKAGSEERAIGMIAGGKVAEQISWMSFLAVHSKKNDLTDAFCMCVDFFQGV